MNRPRPPDAYPSDAHRRDALARAMAHAPFLALLARQRPALVDHFLTVGSQAAAVLVEQASHRDDGRSDVMARLRQHRADLALLVALADLSGEYSLDAVVAALSGFADGAVNTALDAAFAERAPGEPVRGFAVIALGKLGSHELN